MNAPRAALKTATRVLLDRLGGLEAAATCSRLGKSQLGDCASRNNPDRFLPVDVLLDLEAAAEEPVVTAALARAAGCELLRLPAATPGDLGARLMELGQRFAELFAEAGRALADGHVDAQEAERLTAGLCAIRQAAGDTIAVLHAAPHTEGGGNGLDR